MPKNKSKGSNIERELFKLFVKHNYRAIRAAGSGTMENADCDIIAGKKGKGKYAIEVKSSKKPYKYIDKEQIENFVIFSEVFGLKPVIALRFFRKGWLFLKPKDLEEKDKSYMITLEQAKKKGKKFSQFFK